MGGVIGELICDAASPAPIPPSGTKTEKQLSPRQHCALVAHRAFVPPHDATQVPELPQ
jgi:hypothetical protein